MSQNGAARTEVGVALLLDQPGPPGAEWRNRAAHRSLTQHGCRLPRGTHASHRLP